MMNEPPQMFNGAPVFTVPEELLQEISKEYANALVLKPCNPNEFNPQALKSAFQRAWNIPSGEVTFGEDNGNIMIANFSMEKDKERVLKGRPWLFNGWGVLIEKWESPGHRNPSAMINQFKMPIWLQIHGLSIELMMNDQKLVSEFGSLAGEVLCVSDYPVCSSSEMIVKKMCYARVRVNIDIRKPLRRGFYLDRKRFGLEAAYWVLFKYERLPKFCINCGILTHGTTSCDKEKDAGQQLRYMEWLKTQFGSSTDRLV